MSALALEARGLTRRFGGQVAVDRVGLDVGFGEVVGLLGANGAGKTTTIRMLVGLLEPSSGTAMLLGAPPDRDGQRRLGYVPQGLGLYENLTVAENLAFVADTYGTEPPRLTGALEEASDRLVREISLGLQRQVAFASAISHTPDVLVLDEPTSGVGPLAAARLWDRIRREAERGAGVLVTTHSMQEARQCDRLILLADGVVVARGTESDIVDGLTAVEVAADAWSDAFDVLAATGALVSLNGRSVRVVGGSTESIERILADAGIAATITTAAATIDERMASIALTATG